MTASGNLDLTDGLVDARLVLSGATDSAGNRPDIYMALKGPIAAPVRSVDLTALSGWLTLARGGQSGETAARHRAGNAAAATAGRRTCASSAAPLRSLRRRPSI